MKRIGLDTSQLYNGCTYVWLHQTVVGRVRWLIVTSNAFYHDILVFSCYSPRHVNSSPAKWEWPFVSRRDHLHNVTKPEESHIIHIILPCTLQHSTSMEAHTMVYLKIPSQRSEMGVDQERKSERYLIRTATALFWNVLSKSFSQCRLVVVKVVQGKQGGSMAKECYEHTIADKVMIPLVEERTRALLG